MNGLSVVLSVVFRLDFIYLSHFYNIWSGHLVYTTFESEE